MVATTATASPRFTRQVEAEDYTNYQLQERRRSTRQSLGAAGLLIADNGQFHCQLQVLVMNVSLGGVGFRSPIAFKPGSEFTLRIGSGPLHLQSKLKIISSRTREDG